LKGKKRIQKRQGEKEVPGKKKKKQESRRVSQ
jgi:hypothetical protein